MQKHSDPSPILVACPVCGKNGYTDERQYSPSENGYLCARCALPNLQWTIVNN